MNVSADAAHYVSVDRAAEVHAVCLLDEGGKIVTSFPVAHSAEGIATLVVRLARLGPAEEIPVGIERPNGRLVDLLLETGHPIVPVSLNAIKTWGDGGAGPTQPSAGRPFSPDLWRLGVGAPRGGHRRASVD